ADFTYAGPDGAALSVTAQATDLAGNVGSGSFGFKYDATAPQTTDDAPSGWQKTDVTVHLTAGDQAGLSGVGWTEYSTDGGQTWLTYAGGLTVSGQGEHTVAYRSVDAAGNVEAARPFTVKIDLTAPTTTAASSGQAYADQHAGWNNTGVTVTLSAGETGGAGPRTTQDSLGKRGDRTAHRGPRPPHVEG